MTKRKVLNSFDKTKLMILVAIEYGEEHERALYTSLEHYMPHFNFGDGESVSWTEYLDRLRQKGWVTRKKNERLELTTDGRKEIVRLAKLLL